MDMTLGDDLRRAFCGQLVDKLKINIVDPLRLGGVAAHGGAYEISTGLGAEHGVLEIVAVGHKQLVGIFRLDGADELGRSRAVGAQRTRTLHGEDVHAAGHQLIHLFHGDGDVHGGAGVILFDDADDRQVHHLFDLGDVADGVGADAHGSAHGGGFRHQGHDAALFGVKRLRLKCLTGDDEAAFDLSKQCFFLHIHQSSILILMTALRT